MNAASLTGRRVVITRDADDAEPWAARLTALGAEPVVLPCIDIEEFETDDVRGALVAALDGASWLLFLSQHAARAAHRLLGGAIALPSIAAVGDATAELARELFGSVHLVAGEQTAQGVATALAAAGRAAPGIVVIAAALDGRRDADEYLTAHGFIVRRVAIYRTIAAAPGGAQSRLDDADFVLLASPSAARGFVNRVTQPVSARVISIGPTTTQAAQSAGLVVFAEARRPSLDGLLEAMC